MSGDFLDRAAAYTKEGLSRFGYVTDDDLSLRVVRGAVITPRTYGPGNSFTGAVYDRHGGLIGATQRFNERDIVPADPPVLDASERRGPAEHRVQRAIYGGILFPILGHFLFESIARLWPLVDLAPRGEGVRLIFHPWPGCDPALVFDNPLYAAILRALGLDPACVLIADHAIAVDALLLAEPCSRYHLDLNTRMAALADGLAGAIAGPAPGVAGRGLYLSRSRWPENARIRNEQAIDAWAAARGLCVLHPQVMRLPDLLRLLADAETVVASDGSHAHLAVFCRPGTRVVLLDTRPVPTQFAIARLRGFRTLHLPLFDCASYDAAHGLIDAGQLAPLLDAVLAALV